MPGADTPARRPLVVMAHDYPPLTGGGLALAAGELARLLSDDFEFRILSARLVDHFADDRARVGASTNEAGVLYGRATPRRTLAWIRQADVVLLHWTFSFRRLSTLLLAAAPLLGRPTVCVVHTAPDHCDYNRLRRLPQPARRVLFTLVARAAGRCGAVVALSQAHAKALRQSGIGPVRVLPLPVEPDGRSGRAGRRARNGRRTVGAVGELSALKGADAIPALLAELTPRFGVRIAGRGSLSRALRRAVASLPAEQRAGVALSDRLEPEAMPRLYDELDYLLVASRSESQSRVTLEAMCCGVVVLARPAGGIADLVVDGQTGFLVDPDDPGSVRRVLQRLELDQAAVERVRRRAREQAERAFAESRRAWRELLLALTAP